MYHIKTTDFRTKENTSQYIIIFFILYFLQRNTNSIQQLSLFHQNKSTYIHTTQVARLYRKSLKTLSSWVIDRDIFLEEATKLRNRFDEERGCSNAKAVRLLKVRRES